MIFLKMIQMVRNATERSLLLIDEFGKGTEPDDGMALLAATINEFQKRSATPKIIIATHFAEVPISVRASE